MVVPGSCLLTRNPRGPLFFLFDSVADIWVFSLAAPQPPAPGVRGPFLALSLSVLICEMGLRVLHGLSQPLGGKMRLGRPEVPGLVLGAHGAGVHRM